METRQFTQSGKFSVAILLPLLLINLVLIFVAGHNDLSMAMVFGFASLLLLICLLTFYKLTISVSDNDISFTMGIGLVRGTYAFSGIESCRAVKNSVLTGIGIRLIPGGWLFNVSGLKAIELTFMNKKRKIRIGTDKPEEIARLVNEKTGNFYSGEGDSSGHLNRPGIFMAVTILIIILIFPVIMTLHGKRETEVKAGNDLVSIKGIYSMNIRYSDILNIDTISEMPAIRSRTNGYALGNTLKGNFRLSDRTKVKLYITKGVPPYIRIKTTMTTIYINYPQAARTRQLFGTLKAHL
jgi:PPE-repeat protein